ncbi:hypothetical protein HYALB_00012104 [Hymenoscyphus albidus]|uniref:Nephrocystin 3-like N-terminal domain-containing protein n=1 Tax=Hymenoscyphus albidus TaxID=595503 RepID=A0A9N9LL96_9HELO|nr:hypothetical protein HYALB_00012104 [Hymenoscyphus albidus]
MPIKLLYENPKSDLVGVPTTVETGLVFFDTPHAGPTEDAKVMFGRICASIAQSLPTNPSNDTMKALKSGSLFSDVLQEGWRHQLERYRVVSFYEGIGNLVPRESAVFGLAGDRENQVRLNADHRSMCRFHPNVERDAQNYFLVEGDVVELVDDAAKASTRKDKDMNEDMIDELFGSLEPHGRNPRKDRIEDPYFHSFEWLWEQHPAGPGLLEWLQDGKHIFWISGKPGSGKSTLMKQVVKDSRTLEYLETSTTEPVRMLSFFFHELGGNEEQNFLGFLHGFLAQMLRAFKELIPQVMPKFQQLKRNVPLSSSNSSNSISIWSESELIKTLKAIKFEEIHGLTCLFIDGLDGCAGDLRKQLGFLLPWIQSANTSKLSLKVCLASRPMIEIENRLWRFPGFKMHEWTAPDITSYTEGKLREAVALTSSEDSPAIYDNCQRRLVWDITVKSSGVFLWVKLVIEEMIIGIEEGFTDQELQDLLNHLQLLIVVINHHLDLLHFALVCEDPRGALHMNNSWGFSSGYGTIEFIHRTVGEYSQAAGAKYMSHLLTTSDMNFDAFVSLMAASLRLVKMGKCYHKPDSVDLCRPSVKLCRTSLSLFFESAHQAEASTKVAQTLYIEELDVYYQDTEWYDVALMFSEHHKNWETNLLCVAIRYCLRLYILEQSQKGLQVKRGSGRPFLFYTLDQWHYSYAKFMIADLLKYGADVNEVFEGTTPWIDLLSFNTPHHFIEDEINKSAFLCEIMLQNGADIQNPILNFSPLNNILLVVARWLKDGHEPSKTTRNKIANIIALFLDKGADLYQIEDSGETSFQLAEEMKKQYPEMWAVVRRHVEKGMGPESVGVILPKKRVFAELEDQ